MGLPTVRFDLCYPLIALLMIPADRRWRTAPREEAYRSPLKEFMNSRDCRSGIDIDQTAGWTSFLLVAIYFRFAPLYPTQIDYLRPILQFIDPFFPVT